MKLIDTLIGNEWKDLTIQLKTCISDPVTDSACHRSEIGMITQILLQTIKAKHHITGLMILPWNSDGTDNCTICNNIHLHAPGVFQAIAVNLFPFREASKYLFLNCHHCTVHFEGDKDRKIPAVNPIFIC